MTHRTSSSGYKCSPSLNVPAALVWWAWEGQWEGFLNLFFEGKAVINVGFPRVITLFALSVSSLPPEAQAPAAPPMSSRGRSQQRPESPVFRRVARENCPQELLQRQEKETLWQKKSKCWKDTWRTYFSRLLFLEWGPDQSLMITQTWNTNSGNLCFVPTQSVRGETFQVWKRSVRIPPPFLLPSLSTSPSTQFPPPS